ncbi:MAG: ABC transporter permease [Bacteroidales bacterium]|nr:ABC transporter permease [Bacteroidales bacterium]
MNFFVSFGSYLLLLKSTLGKPPSGKYFRRQLVDELSLIGLNSLGIVLIISVFMGAVLVIQAGYNLQNPLIPRFTIGNGVRESLILEFSPTIVSLILAGKIGSSISSQIGSMRVTEQIDALDIMGINSASFIIFPKIVAALFSFPFLITISMVTGMLGGYSAAVIWDIVSATDFILGLHLYFYPFEIIYALIKTIIFAFLIVTISAYHGYYVKGGALAVGKSSTKAVVYSSIAILTANVLITKLILI